MICGVGIRPLRRLFSDLFASACAKDVYVAAHLELYDDSNQERREGGSRGVKCLPSPAKNLSCQRFCVFVFFFFSQPVFVSLFQC
jgi:hypothetical protein